MSSTQKAILVTGATGKQGGAVVDCLSKNEAFQVLAVTRNSNSAAAKALVSKYPNLKLVEGDMDDTPKLFHTARDIAGGEIWGVFSVQISQGKGVTFEGEVRQGKAMIDESIKTGVKSFVYSSVERGGDEASWETQTPIEHFKTKYFIERHLRENAKDSMKWTVLRPVALMENLTPGFPTTVFFTAMKAAIGTRPMQWVATYDVGRFAEKAFSNPEKYDRRAIGLAGDQMTFSEMSGVLESITGSPAGTTYWFFAAALRWAVPDIAVMLDWFGSDGYQVDVPKLRKEDPELMDFKTWLKTQSTFPTKG
jgi:uncharacterized protein YbjT (DUF2867 family)